MPIMSPEKSPAKAAEDAGQQDVWQELFSTVSFLSDTVELSLQAFSPEQAVGADGKAVSATTKKRMAVKSVHNLKLSKDSVQLLQEHLKALQVASQQWQKTMMYASKSHEELMEQLENTNRDLHLTTERLRTIEAQNFASSREADSLRAQLQRQEADHRGVQATLQHRCEELETARFATMELQAQMAQQAAEAASAKESMLTAQAERDRAVATLDAVKAEAEKATGAAQRHQEAIAKLTADNLVFLMNLKKAEAELAAANQDKAQLQLAAEKQRGPWFDEVRASVEERVRHAMVKAESLEAELQAVRQQHTTQLQQLESEKCDLEDFLSKMREREASMEHELVAARAARDDAVAAAAAAQAAAAASEQRLEELSMRCSVLQDSVKAMRQECTERWVHEQAAVGQVSGLESRIASLQQELSDQQAEVGRLRAQLATQHAVNRQLMSKKEEVEWQLMAAMAKVGLAGRELTKVGGEVIPAAAPPPPPPAPQPTPIQPQQPQLPPAPTPAESASAVVNPTSVPATVSSLASDGPRVTVTDPLPRRLASDFYIPVKPVVPVSPPSAKKKALGNPTAAPTAAPSSPFMAAVQQLPQLPSAHPPQPTADADRQAALRVQAQQLPAATPEPVAAALASPPAVSAPPAAPLAIIAPPSPPVLNNTGSHIVLHEVSFGGAASIEPTKPIPVPDTSPVQHPMLVSPQQPATDASKVQHPGQTPPPRIVRPHMPMFGDDAFSITHSSPLTKGPRVSSIQPLHPIFGTLPVSSNPSTASGDHGSAGAAQEGFGGGAGRRVSATSVVTTPPPKAFRQP